MISRFIFLFCTLLITLPSRAGGFSATAFWSGNEDTRRQTDSVMTYVDITGSYPTNSSRFSETDSTVTRTVTLKLWAAKSYDVTVYWRSNIGHTILFPTETDLPLSGSVVIPKGQTSAVMTYQIFANTLPESDRVIDISFYATNAKAVSIGPRSNLREIVKDNDQPINDFYLIDAGGSATCGLTAIGVLQCWGNDLPAGAYDKIYNPSVMSPESRYQAVSVGLYWSSCALTVDGYLDCWGVNSSGLLANGTTTGDTPQPTRVDGSVTYSKVSAGNAHICAITTAGALRCWGDNSSGQVGDGTTTTRLVTTLIDSGVSYIELGTSTGATCAITNGNVLKCWGDNGAGRLGDGTTVAKTSPVVIDSGVSYSKVSLGGLHSCGITTGGVLKCWGDNGWGQLGDGTTTSSLTPITSDAGTSYVAVATGGYYTCGITTTGVLKCWGMNDVGQLGDSTNTDRVSPTVIDAGTSYGVISARYNHTCAVTSAGANKCWGYGGYAATGLSHLNNVNVPTQIKGFNPNVYRLSAGANHVCALHANGNISCWGSNTAGKLGIGSAAVAVSTMSSVDSGVKYKFIGLGTDHTCGITSGDALKCWGKNTSGQLGIGSAVDQSTPVAVDGGTSYKMVSGGSTHTCAITLAGVLKCWGDNTTGQLGDGTTTAQSSPVVINAGTSYRYVDVGYSHSCAITVAGVLHCWGSNSKGEVGDGTTTQRLSPTVIASGTSYLSVSLGDRFSCGITSSFTLYCWGLNAENQVGDTTTTDRSSPTQIGVGSYFSEVNSGKVHSCATVRYSLDVRCWGSSGAGYVRGSDNGGFSDPTYMYFFGSESGVPGFGNFTCHLRTHIGGDDSGDSVYCQGFNLWGEWGNGKIGYNPTPQTIDSGVSYSKLGAGLNHICAVTAAGQLRCWGRAVDEALSGGASDTANKSVPTATNSRELYSAGSASTGTHTCGINTTGRLQCWGKNTQGQAGRGNTSTVSLISTTDNGVLYSVVETANEHSCGVTTTGILKCWGRNNVNQLGDNTVTRRTSPKVIDSGTSYSRVSVAGNSSCGITVAGVLKCWGDNTNYQLGDGTNTQRALPVVIDSGTNYSEVSVGLTCSCGITTGNVLKCWGANTNSCVGDGTTTLRASPVVVDSGVSYAKVSSGRAYNTGCAITTGGVLKCWGQNQYGNVGDGTYSDSASPTVINSGTSYAEVTTGSATCGVTVAGVLKCWGDNRYGQVGIGFMPMSYYSITY